MPLIDEQGNLLGRVNIIDALVVLLALAVLVTGVAFAVSTGINQGGQQSTGTETKYATIDLGKKPTHIAEMISENYGESEETNGGLNVTDVYIGPTKKSGSVVVIRIEFSGQTSESENGRFTFAGTQYRQGDKITFTMNEYRIKGQVQAVDADGPSLDTRALPVRLKVSVSDAVARGIERGDTYRIGEQSVATVRNVTVIPNRSNQTVFLGVTLQTINRSGNVFFGEFNVKLGSTVPFHTANYTLSPTVVRKGSTSPPGEPVNAVVVVKLANVSPTVANETEIGEVKQSGNTSVMKVLERRVEPASVILTSDNGNIYQRAHPQKKDVYLTIQLRATQTDTSLRFRGSPLQVGEHITVDFGTIPINGTVVKVSDTS